MNRRAFLGALVAAPIAAALPRPRHPRYTRHYSIQTDALPKASPDFETQAKWMREMQEANARLNHASYITPKWTRG